MSRNFTLAVERVADDRRFAERFRRNPERALSHYRLDADQVEAVKSGDPLALRSHGLDLDAFQDGKRHGIRPHLRKVVAGASVLGAALGMLVMPRAASATDICKIDFCPEPGPVFTGLRAAEGRTSIRLGRILVSRSSMLRALRRAGARFDSARRIGRTEVRARLLAICDGKACFGEFEDGGPIEIAVGD